jgi:tetratricopeptide (TPR) repeat protein
MVGRVGGYQRAREAAERALRLDPSLSEAQALLGSVAGLYDFDWAEAAKWFRLAVAHERVPPHTRMHYGYHLLLIGQLDAARAEYERALAEDPLHPLYRAHLAFYFAVTRDYSRAKAELQKVLDIDGSAVFVHAHLASILFHEGHIREALASAERASAADTTSLNGMLAGLLALNGDTHRSEALRATLQPSDAPGVPMGLALYHLARGQLDEASHWLERAIEQRDIAAVGALRTWTFDAVPRRDVLMRMVKLPVVER